MAMSTQQPRPPRLTVSRAERGAALLAVLSARLGLSRRGAKARLDARRVFVNGRRVWMAHHRLEPGDVIDLAPDPAPGPADPTTGAPLYADADFLVVNKPAGWLSNGPRSIEAAWRAAVACPELAAAHRLDRDTSGCLLLARHAAAEARMRPLFARRDVRKVYRAIAAGQVRGPAFEIARPVDGEPARTQVQVLDAGRRASHLQLVIETGRTHQIRRHLAAIGHPLLGDPLYAGRRPLDAPERAVPRQMLHAAALEFLQPIRGTRVAARAPLPADFRECLRRFRLR